MTITTGMSEAMAATKADLVYDASDDLGFDVTCFFSISGKYHHADRSVGAPSGWDCSATLIGCQIGLLVLGADDADHALNGHVRRLERNASEYETDRRNDEGYEE